eukprot:scaffold13241_cov60-Phaeocystis_antarctica.AAC.2
MCSLPLSSLPTDTRLSGILRERNDYVASESSIYVQALLPVGAFCRLKRALITVISPLQAHNCPDSVHAVAALWVRLASMAWPRPEFRLEAPQISFINLPDSGPNLQKIRLKGGGMQQTGDRVDCSD